MMDFSEALVLLKRGHALTREGWNKPHTIALYRPDDGEVCNAPHIVITIEDVQMTVPWVASQTDILATDWRMAG